MNWYIHVDQQNVGPLTEEEIHARLSRGEINGSTLIWREGMAEWAKIASSSFANFLNSLHPTPPPVAASVEKKIFDYFIDAFKKYAVFSERASRREYWYFMLGNFLAVIGIAVVGAGIHAQFLVNIYQLGAFIPSVAVAIRRMHDVNKSGWFCLVPIYNLILAARAGDTGPNRFGPVL